MDSPPPSPTIQCDSCFSACSTLIPFGKCEKNHDICFQCFEKSIGRELSSNGRYMSYDDLEIILSSTICKACINELEGIERHKKWDDRDKEIEILFEKVGGIINENSDLKRYIELIRARDYDFN